MASNKNSREAQRLKRKQRVRANIKGTDSRPRLCVYRSNKYTYAQLISDESGQVFAAASTRFIEESASKEDGSVAGAGSMAMAEKLGQKIASLAKEKNIDKVVFDRNGYVYHGRVAAVASGARAAGLLF